MFHSDVKLPEGIRYAFNQLILDINALNHLIWEDLGDALGWL